MHVLTWRGKNVALKLRFYIWGIHYGCPFFNTFTMEPFTLIGLSLAALAGAKSIKARNIEKTALKYLGAPYVWGGCSPSGFDCSGFVQTVYKENNINLPRTTLELLKFPKSISRKKGDIVLFAMPNGGRHVGIYLGNNKMIHASSTRGVVVEDISNYWQPLIIEYKAVF